LLAAGVATALNTPNYKVNRRHVTRVKPAEESLQIYPLTSPPPQLSNQINFFAFYNCISFQIALYICDDNVYGKDWSLPGNWLLTQHSHQMKTKNAYA
jgi:hypothetical protein